MYLCKHPISVKGKSYNCGKCRACRLSRRGEWALRMSHEAACENNGNALFVTLTYRNHSLPPRRSLKKTHLQEYFRHLRKYKKLKFRYYACGEYGPTTDRPHYHIIFFGLTMRDAPKLYEGWLYGDIWDCKKVCGNKAYAYTAGYVSKKLGREYLAKKGREPEFQLQSKGIGREYCDKYCSKDYPYIHISGDKKRLLPRYYRKRLGITYEDISDYVEERERELEERIFAQSGTYTKLFDGSIIKTSKYHQIILDIRSMSDKMLKRREEEWRDFKLKRKDLYAP